MDNIDNEVIEVLKLFPENRARWYQIRNALMMQNPEFNSEDLKNSLGVKLTRSLKRLVDSDDVIREDLGHKNTFYKLAPKFSQEQDFFPIFLGVVNPLNKMPTYNEFKKKLIEVPPCEDLCESDYLEAYEEFKKQWESFQNIRNLKRKK